VTFNFPFSEIEEVAKPTEEMAQVQDGFESRSPSRAATGAL